MLKEALQKGRKATTGQIIGNPIQIIYVNTPYIGSKGELLVKGCIRKLKKCPMLYMNSNVQVAMQTM